MFPLLPLLYLTSWSVTPYGYFAHWEWPHLVPLFLYWFRFPSKDKRFSLFMVVMPIELPQIINHRTYENTSLGFHKPWTLPTIDQHLILFHVYFCLKTPYSSLVAQWVKTLPTMQETWIWFLGWEDLLEKEMASHSSILAWEIPQTEKPGRLQSLGSQRVGHNWATSLDWPLPVSLTMITLLILILAVGLVTVSPQDWPPILCLSVGIAYVASCVLLLGCYFFCTA